MGEQKAGCTDLDQPDGTARVAFWLLIPRREIVQTIIAGLVYFGIVFGAGFAFGVFREIALTPVYGRTTAVMLEVPFMLVAIAAGAWTAVHRGSLGQSKLPLLLVGLFGLALVQIADFGVGLGLRGMSVQDQLDYLKTAAGQIYLGLLAIFVLMPLFLGHFAVGRPEASTKIRSDSNERPVTD
jgi:hypothetical protein